jgi:hypothetical protein
MAGGLKLALHYAAITNAMKVLVPELWGMVSPDFQPR